MRTLLSGLLAALLLCAPAAAKSRDRDRDRLPDRWERKHHLNVGKRDGARDPDRDGLRNALEFKAGTNPRRADSDGDGVSDGAEVIGKVRRIDGDVLVVKLLRGGFVTGSVDEETVVDCDPAATARASGIPPLVDLQQEPDPGTDPEEDPGADEDPEAGEEPDPDAEPGDEASGDDALADDSADDGEEELSGEDPGCGLDALGKGTRVYGAELAGGRFVAVELY